MSNGQMTAPMVIRVGAGAVRSAGPHHSGTYHPIWAHIPGLIVCLPSNPADAKGLMKTALRAGDPVMMLETQGPVRQQGTGARRASIWCPSAWRGSRVRARTSRSPRPARWFTVPSRPPRRLEEEGISCEVIDLRTIQPLDVETVAESVRKTHRLLVVDEAYSMFGVGAELGQAMNELASTISTRRSPGCTRGP